MPTTGAALSRAALAKLASVRGCGYTSRRMDSSAPANGVRLGWSFIAGCAAGVPAGVLLSYLAVLPLFLGLFFFLLLGLMVGAIMFRFGRGAAPASRRSLWLLGSAVVLVMWTTTLFVEYLLFPGYAAQQVARQVSKSRQRRLQLEERKKIESETRQYVLSRLAGRQYRGTVLDGLRGFAGYLGWVVRDGSIQSPRVLDDATVLVQVSQRRRAWVFRVVASLALLEFAVLSQFLGLSRPPKKKRGDENPPDPGSIPPASP
jgi:hypothetical protein